MPPYAIYFATIFAATLRDTFSLFADFAAADDAAAPCHAYALFSLCCRWLRCRSPLRYAAFAVALLLSPDITLLCLICRRATPLPIFDISSYAAMPPRV